MERGGGTNTPKWLRCYYLLLAPRGGKDGRGHHTRNGRTIVLQLAHTKWQYSHTPWCELLQSSNQFIFFSRRQLVHSCDDSRDTCCISLSGWLQKHLYPNMHWIVMYLDDVCFLFAVWASKYRVVESMCIFQCCIMDIL